MPTTSFKPVPFHKPLAAFTRAQLKDLRPGDRVSRIAAQAVVETAPVKRCSATQIVVVWPNGSEARYWRETGRRAGCQHEILRMPEDAQPTADGVDRELEARIPLGCDLFGQAARQ